MAGADALEHGASKGVLIMVAQIKPEVFQHPLCSPERDPLDSEGVRLALETARGLEYEGEFGGAVQWLRRAAREAEKQGNVVRVEELTRAAEELAERALPEDESIVASLSAPISNVNDDDSIKMLRSGPAIAPFAESRAPRSERSGAPLAPPPLGSIPPLLAALISSMPPFSSRPSAEIPPPARIPSQPMPLPASPPPAPPSQASAQCPPTESRPHAVSASVANDNLVDRAPERMSRVSAFRAAIPAGQRPSSFFIQQLASSQCAPAGMVEVMIVVTGEGDGTTSFEASLGVAKDNASEA